MEFPELALFMISYQASPVEALIKVIKLNVKV